MTENVENKQKRIPTKPFIYVACVLAVAGTIPVFLLCTTELAYMVGKWFPRFLLISSFLTWLIVAGVWRMKKWAVIAYTIIVVITQTVLFRYNPIWGYNSLILPILVILIIWIYFRKMT